MYFKYKDRNRLKGKMIGKKYSVLTPTQRKLNGYIAIRIDFRAKNINFFLYRSTIFIMIKRSFSSRGHKNHKYLWT